MQKLGLLRESWKKSRGCVYVSMCLLYICVCIFFFIKCPSFHVIKHVNWIWFLSTTGGRWHRATFQTVLHFPVFPRASSCNCVSHPEALSFTALQSALSSTTPSHLIPLKMCLIANPSPWIFFFFSVRLLSFFNICFITFPAAVFLSLFFRHFLYLLGFPTQPNTGLSFVYVILLSFIWATIASPNMAPIINGTNWIKLLPASKLKHFKTELLFVFFVQHLICTSVTHRNEYSAYAMLPSPTTLNSATISDQLSNVIGIIFMCVLLGYLLFDAMLEPRCQSALL